MSKQITVSISGNVTAVVTYHFPSPINLYYASGGNGYDLIKDGVEWHFSTRIELEFHLTPLLEGMAVKPAISNIVFLQSKYTKKALCIHGTDLLTINKALSYIEPMEFNTAAELIDYSLPDLPY